MPEHGHGILEGAAVWSRHADLFTRVVRLFCIFASCCALGAHIPGLIDLPDNPCSNRRIQEGKGTTEDEMFGWHH